MGDFVVQLLFAPLIRDRFFPMRSRTMNAVMLHLTSDLQQQREPNGDPVKVITVALQSSIIGRSVGHGDELMLSEDDVLAE